MSNLPPIYGVLDKGQKHLAKPEVKAEMQKNVEEIRKRNAMLPPNQSSKGGRSRLSRKFNRCVKSVKKTVKARKGSNKESAAIAICTKSVLQKRGRTMKRYTRKRLMTQKKFRGGATVPTGNERWEPYLLRLSEIVVEDPIDGAKFDTLLKDMNNDEQLEYKNEYENAEKTANIMMMMECEECIDTLKKTGMTMGDFENIYSDIVARTKAKIAIEQSPEEVQNMNTMLETMKAYRQRMLTSA